MELRAQAAQTPSKIMPLGREGLRIEVRLPNFSSRQRRVAGIGFVFW